jgi:hypothetical protein
MFVRESGYVMGWDRSLIIEGPARAFAPQSKGGVGVK